MEQYLPAGEIVNTHGIHGEVRIMPWADNPEFLTGFSTLYVEGAAMAVQSARVQKTGVLVKFRGVDTVEAAAALRGRTVSIDRNDAKIPDGSFFIADLKGLTAVDQNGREIGVLEDVLILPRHDVYVVRGEEEYLIPAVPEFVRKIDPGAGKIHVKIIEGMDGHEN